MSSIPSKSSIISSLKSIDAYREQPTSPADTTTTSALARDAAVIPVTSATGIAAAEPFFLIGDGGTELNTVASLAALNVTPSRKIAIAQSIGAQFLEAVKYPLGHIAEDSARIGGASTINPIPAATSATPIGYINVGGELSFAFSLISFDVRSLAMFFGMPELETGAGSSADPYQIAINQSVVGTHGLQCFRATAVRHDGWNAEIDMLDCTLQVNGDIDLSGKSLKPIAISGRCTAHIVRLWV